jgi:hypothetical protein
VQIPALSRLDREVKVILQVERVPAILSLNPGNAQAAKADDAGTKQRGDVYVVVIVIVIQAGGKREGEVGAHQGILGIAAIYRVSGEDGAVA